MPELYPYAAARIHARELSLLSRQNLEQLLAAKTYDECIHSLHGLGWTDGETAEEILAAETEKNWQLMGEILPDLSLFQIFRLPVDFNNAKAAVKSTVTNVKPEHVFLPGGTIPPEDLLKALMENDFSILPQWIREPLQEAQQVLLKTRDGQMCDVLLDKAALEAVLQEGGRSECALLGDYAELFVAAANLKIAQRAVTTGRPASFLPQALAECRTLSKKSLEEAAMDGMDGLEKYLSLTPYADAVPALKAGASAFDKWRDDRIMKLIQGEKANPFTLGPAAAYFLARQNEIAMVRIILSAKRNGLDVEAVQERLREMYV